eukprot:gene6989-9551_t
MNIYNSCCWIHKHCTKADPPSVTLAVQTLRNTMIVAVFVGGSSLQFGFTFLNSYKDSNDIVSNVRIGVLSVFLFFSFLCWASVIRLASHLGYLLGVADINQSGSEMKQTYYQSNHNSHDNEKKLLITENSNNHVNSLAEAQRMMTSLVLFYSLGFRFIFVAIPFAFYSMGPVALIIATIILMLFLAKYDFKL